MEPAEGGQPGFWGWSLWHPTIIAAIIAALGAMAAALVGSPLLLNLLFDRPGTPPMSSSAASNSVKDGAPESTKCSLDLSPEEFDKLDCLQREVTQ
jgi:hypothetical protein